MTRLSAGNKGGNISSANCHLPIDEALDASGFLAGIFTNPKNLEAARAELLPVLAKFPRVLTLLQSYPEDPQALDITKSLMLLHLRSAGQTRDLSNEKKFIHSIRNAENFLEVVDGAITNRQFLIENVCAAALHDIIEDFDTSLVEVDKLIPVHDVTDRVDHLTTPSVIDLAAKYKSAPPIALPLPKPFAHLAKGMPTVEQLRAAAGKERRKELESILTWRYKLEALQKMKLGTLINKAIDNFDTLRDKATGVEKGLIEVITATALTFTSVPSLNGAKPLLAPEEEQSVLRRTSFHRDFITPRLREFALLPNAVATPEGIALIERRLHKLLMDASDDYARHVQRPRVRPPVEEVRTAAHALFRHAKRQFPAIPGTVSSLLRPLSGRFANKL